jgi:hypothetical protein
LHPKEIVLVGDLDELLVTAAPRPFVSSECKVWVPFFAVLANYFAVIKLVFD